MTTTRVRAQLSKRNLLVLLALLAFGAWGLLLLFTYFVQPQGTVAILVVFLLLSTALFGTCTLVIYFVSRLVLSSRRRSPNLLQTLREGALTTAWIIFNLLLSTLHSWSVFTTVVSFGIIVVVELLILLY